MGDDKKPLIEHTEAPVPVDLRAQEGQPPVLHATSIYRPAALLAALAEKQPLPEGVEEIPSISEADGAVEALPERQAGMTLVAERDDDEDVGAVPALPAPPQGIVSIVPRFVHVAPVPPPLPDARRHVVLSVRRESFLSMEGVAELAQHVWIRTRNPIGPVLKIADQPVLVTTAIRVVRVLDRPGISEVTVDVVHAATRSEDWAKKWRTKLRQDDQRCKGELLRGIVTLLEHVPAVESGLVIRFVGCSPMKRELVKTIGAHYWTPNRFVTRVEIDAPHKIPTDPWERRLPAFLYSLLRLVSDGPAAPPPEALDRSQAIQPVLTVAAGEAGPAIASFGSAVYQNNAQFRELLGKHAAATSLQGTVMATHLTYFGE